jgi:hypothetical protein
MNAVTNVEFFGILFFRKRRISPQQCCIHAAIFPSLTCSVTSGTAVLTGWKELEVCNEQPTRGITQYRVLQVTVNASTMACCANRTFETPFVCVS